MLSFLSTRRKLFNFFSNLKCGSAHEVLLLQAEFLPLEEVIVGVQDARDVLRDVSVDHSLDVVTIID